MAGMVPEDVYELTGVADPRLSPDGTTVAYVVGSVDKDANEYKAAIWVAAVDGSSPPRRFTTSDKADGDPRWSPDGTQLAFTSNRADKASQLYVHAGGRRRAAQAHEPQGGRDAGGLVAGRHAPLLRRARARRGVRGGGRQEAVAAAAHAPAVQARQRGLDGRPAAAPVRRPGRRLGRAGAAHGRRLRRPLAVLVARRGDDRLRLGPAPGLGPRDGERRLPGRRRGRGAAAAHAGRRQRRRPILVAGRQAARDRAVRRRLRRPQAHEDRGGRRSDRGDHHAHRGARPQLHHVPRHARAAVGRRTTSSSSSRTTAARTCTAWPPTAPASRG